MGSKTEAKRVEAKRVSEAKRVRTVFPISEAGRWVEW
jgi:hypothetical protein